MVTSLAPVPDTTPVPVAEVLFDELKNKVAEFPPPSLGFEGLETVMVNEVILSPNVGT